MSNLDSIMDELETSINEDISKLSLKHLFDKLDKKQILLKTELNDNEIKRITKLKFIAENLELKKLNSMITTFMQLRVSLERKGRNEVIDALKTITDNKTGKSMFSAFGQPPISAPR